MSRMQVTSASIFARRSWVIWCAGERRAELLAPEGVADGGLVGGDRVAERAPRDAGAGGGEDADGVVEGRRVRELVLGGDADVAEHDVGLPGRALGDLPGDEGGLDAGRVLLDDVGADVALPVARPHDHEVGEHGVADPALLAVEDVAVAEVARPGLEDDGVAAVVGLGEGERADLLELRHRGEPAVLLLLRPEHRDRVHGEAGVDAVEGAHRAVAARELHRHEAGGERAEPGHAVALVGAAADVQLGEGGDELERELRPLPVAVDDGADLLVAEAPDPVADRALLLRELEVGQVEVAGRRVARAHTGSLPGLRPLRAGRTMAGSPATRVEGARDGDLPAHRVHVRGGGGQRLLLPLVRGEPRRRRVPLPPRPLPGPPPPLRLLGGASTWTRLPRALGRRAGVHFGDRCVAPRPSLHLDDGACALGRTDARARDRGGPAACG